MRQCIELLKALINLKFCSPKSFRLEYRYRKTIKQEPIFGYYLSKNSYTRNKKHIIFLYFIKYFVVIFISSAFYGFCRVCFQKIGNFGRDLLSCSIPFADFFQSYWAVMISPIFSNQAFFLSADNAADNCRMFLVSLSED